MVFYFRPPGATEAQYRAVESLHSISRCTEPDNHYFVGDRLHVVWYSNYVKVRSENWLHASELQVEVSREGAWEWHYIPTPEDLVINIDAESPGTAEGGNSMAGLRELLDIHACDVLEKYNMEAPVSYDHHVRSLHDLVYERWSDPLLWSRILIIERTLISEIYANHVELVDGFDHLESVLSACEEYNLVDPTDNQLRNVLLFKKSMQPMFDVQFSETNQPSVSCVRSVFCLCKAFISDDVENLSYSAQWAASGFNALNNIDRQDNAGYHRVMQMLETSL